ncbi:MAG: hypothetical protein ACE5DN_00300, partial [Flavobacteriales bacterium]
MRPLKPRIAGLCTGPILCKVMIIAIALLAFSLVYQSNAFSQSKSRQEARLLKKARKLLAEINYREAKEVYEKLISTDSNNVHYNFEQGICYYNSYVDRDKSIRYFERALANMASDSIGEVFYYLGRVYHYVGRFEDAIREYNNFKQFILHNKPGMVLQRDVERYMEMCRNGIRYYEALNSSIKITNLGSEVNSPYPEYAPVINPGETTLLFAARKKGGTGNRFYHDDKYYEDIYFSSLEDDEWSKPSKFDSTDEHISSRINTRKHEAPIIYSEDGQKLFIYRKNHVWISRFENSKWTKPVKLNANVNSRGMGAHEPSAYMTSDEKTLFITSNRKGGFGGRDIWKSEKQEDGSWGPVQNLGQLINTIYDEDAPFVSPDGKTLYFSSNGHKTMGGYDIFASKWDSVNAQWSEPVNLGAPINTPADDIYYITDEREEDGYYASSMQGGYGDMDIYHIQLSCENIPFTEVRGLVVAGKSRIPVGAAIRVRNKETGEDMGTFHSDPHTGKYLMVLPPENTYDLELATDGYEYKHRETFTIPKQCDYYQLFQEIQVSYLRDSSGRIFAQEGHFHDAFFDARQKAAELFLLDSLVVAQGAEKDTAVPLLVLTGIIKHNETTPARGIRVGVMGDGDTVYAKTLSDESGIWRVENLSARKQYTLLINGYDLQKQYYGTDTIEKSVIVNGKVFYSALPDDDHNPPFTPVARMQ